MSGFLARLARTRPTFGQLIDDLLILATGQFLSKILGFFAFAYLARKLSVEDYGAIETAVGMAAIGAVTIELGTNAVGVRHVAQKERSPADVLGNVILARAAIALLLIPALVLLYIAATPSTNANHVFWLYGVSLLAMPFKQDWFFQSQERMGVAGFGQTLKMGVFFACVLILMTGGEARALSVGYAEIAAAAVMASWYTALALQMIGKSRPHFDVRYSVRIFSESAPLGGSGLVNAGAQYLPILIVASFGNDQATAEFGAAQRLLLSLIAFSFVYYFNLYPSIARLAVSSQEKLRALINASVKVTGWGGVAAALMLSSLATFIMKTVFGAQLEGAGSAFAILVWSIPLTLGSGNARWLLVSSNRQNRLLLSQCIGAVATLAVGYALAPSFGAEGVSCGVVAGAAALWISAHALTRGQSVRPSLSALGAPAALALVTAALLFFWSPPPFLAGAIAAAALGAGIFMDRGLWRAIKTLAAAKSRNGAAPASPST